MAKMRIGTKTVTPVRNIPSYHGDDIIEILNNEDLSNALDGKVDKVSAPSVFYGTDSNGSQTTYDLSLLLDTETSPDGYTDVEYISSGNENVPMLVEKNISAQTSSFCGFEILDESTFFDYLENGLPGEVTWTVTRIRFVLEETNPNNVWYQYVNNANGEGSYNAGSIQEEDFESTCGIRPIYTSASARSLHDMATLEKVYSFGQYIDTGLVFENYEYGHAAYDRESSQVGQYFQTWWVENKGAATQTTINQMSSLTGKDITRMKFVMNRTQSSTSLTLYAVDSEGNETSFNTFANDTACQDACGITMTWGSLSDGDYVYYDYYPKTIDNWGIETSLKLSDYEVTQTSNYLCGSMSMYGNFGCGLRCTENDGILYKHYTPNAQNGFRIPYNKGNWNKIKMEPGIFTLNGESVGVSTSSTIHTVSGQTFILFGVTREDGVKASGMSMKKTKIYKNGELVFNGIPCVEDSSGIAGMYDLVTQQFFKSAKEDVEFIAGPLYEAEDRLNLGVKGTDVILGLNKEGNISTYSGKNGIVIESIIGLDDYEELEYIESTDGNLAFNTQRSWGMSGTTMTSTKWEITYYQTYTSAESGGKRCQYVFGDGMFADMGQNFNRIDFRFYDGQGSFPYTSTSGNRGAMSADGIFMEELETWNTFAFDYQKLYLNNAVIKSLDYPIAQVVHSKNFHIFTAPDAIMTGNFGGGFIGRISRVKEFSSNTTLANFVPVRRKSDNEIGFYDTVNGTFCPNIGAGIPIAGPAKTGTISLEKSLDCFLENIATQKDTSLMITTPTLPSSGTVKNLDGSSDLVIGPYGEITDGGSNSIAINGKVTGSGAIVIGKNSSTSAGYSVVVGNDVEVDGSSSVVVGRGGTSSTSFTVGSYSVILGNEIQTAKRSGVVAIGYHVYAYNGNNLVAIGNGAASYGNLSVSIGYGAQSLNGYGIALGANARINGDYGIAIGNTSSNADENRTLAGASAIAIGSNARAESNSVSIGHLTKANGGSSVNIGTQSTIPYGSTIVIGYGATVSGGDCGVGIGVNSRTSSTGVAVGYGAKSYGNNDIVIGYNSEVNGTNSVAIGKQAKTQSNSNSSIAIGEEATVGSGNSYSIAIGCASQVTGSTSTQGIAIGETATVSKAGGIAIGKWAQASGTYSVALGAEAVASANEAIQLGQGTNNSTHTLQFFNTPVLNSSAQLEYERLSDTTPQNGYVLTYDSTHGGNRLTWTEVQGGGGSYVLPIASASTLGGIKVGSGLEIDSETGILSVIEQPGGEGEGVWGQITGDINDQTDLKEILDSKFDQVLEIPRASNAYNNKVLQYIGISDLLYKHGYVYECQYRKVSQITGTTSDESRFNVTFDARRFEEYCKAYADFDPSEGNYVCDFDEGDNNWHLAKNGYEFFQISKNNLQYCGIYVDYSGSNEPQTDDAVYMNYIKSTNVNAPFGYVWLQTNVQPGVSVIDNVTSTSTTDALSANQGRVLQEQINTLESIGQFLAIWDCNKNGHNARYLDNGYQYQRGNYFIIGAVEEWNYDPDKGPITVSFDTNNHVAISGGYTTTGDELKLYNRYKPTTDATFKFTWNVSSQKWYDETKHTYLDAGSLLSTIGFCPSHNAKEVQAADLVEGDYFEVLYTHTHNYFPVGDTYYEAPDAGCVRTYEDIHVSDMIFYDGQNWVLLANHSKQIAVDHDLSTTSTNPVENATVTNALNTKVSQTSEANRVYGTTSLGEQIALTLGEDLQISEGKLSTTIDLSTKQDVLVDSGEDQNIKTINGESILGSGDIVIEGGSGGEGIGTLNVANAFITSADIISDEDSPYNYKGSYSHIMITTNGDKDYLLDHMHDFYITTMRRTKLNGVRKFRSLNDHRVPTNIHLHCWRVPTYKYWDYNLRQFSEYPLDQRTPDQMSDVDYVYFYTLGNFNSVEDLISSDPNVLVSDLRRDGEVSIQEENVTQGNWGTCLNLMNNVGRKDTTLTVRYFVKSYNSNIERCARYDIDKIVNLTNAEMDMDIRHYEDTEVFKKMRGRLYKNTNGDKVYLWSNGWEKTNNPVFACLGENDEPVVNYVPLDKRDISQWCTYNQFVAMGWELVEKRVDLDWFYFDYDLGYDPYDVLLNVRSISTTTWGSDGTSFYYLLDNPIQPVNLAECKIYMKELPYVYVESGEENPYEQYWHRAYSWYEIKDNEDLMHMLNNQKEIIFVLPHDTYNFWMRTFRWERYVYHHMQQSDIYVDGEPTALNAPTVEQISRDDGTHYYEWDGGYTTQPLVAHPTERHNLKAGIETTYTRRDRNFKNNYSPDVFWGGFENDLATRLGDKHRKFNWNMKDDNSMWLPIAFSIATGHEVGMDCIGKETPVERTMTINGRGYQGLI